MGRSIWILGLCVNKAGSSSYYGPMVLADQVADPVERRSHQMDLVQRPAVSKFDPNSFIEVETVGVSV